MRHVIQAELVSLTYEHILTVIIEKLEQKLSDEVEIAQYFSIKVAST